MRALQIVGYKKSGKTTLAEVLAKALEQSGLKVSILKFSHHGFDLAGCDTARLSAPGRIVAGVSEDRSMVLWNEKRWVLDMLPLLRADFLLVEGGKSLGLMPRVICLDNLENLEALKPGLALAAFGGQPHNTLGHIPHFYPNDLKNPQKISELTTLATNGGFILPGLNCEACGRASCEELAGQILRKQAFSPDCRAVGDEITVSVNGHPVGLNPFTAKIVAGSIRGMLRELKGIAPGSVEIKINEL